MSDDYQRQTKKLKKDIAELENLKQNFIAKKMARIEKLEVRLHRLEARQKSAARRERAHRLIELGAELEHIAGRKLTVDDLKRASIEFENVESET